MPLANGGVASGRFEVRRRTARAPTRSCSRGRRGREILVAPTGQHERNQFEISRKGLHWEALDEDISIAGLLAGLGDHTRSALQAA